MVFAKNRLSTNENLALAATYITVKKARQFDSIKMNRCDLFCRIEVLTASLGKAETLDSWNYLNYNWPKIQAKI